MSNEQVRVLLGTVARQQRQIERLEQLLSAHHAARLSRTPHGEDCPACLADGYWREQPARPWRTTRA